MHGCLNAKVFIILVVLLAVGTVATVVMGFSGRPLWATCFVLSARWVAASAASSTSVTAFLVGAGTSWAGTFLQQWWNGPSCYSVSASQFANLRQGFDCGHELDRGTTSTTTGPAKQASFIGWDFWWWIRAAMFSGALLTVGLCRVGFYLLRCYVDSNDVGVLPRVDTGIDVGKQRADLALAMRAAPGSPLALPLAVASKGETARAQVAFIRGWQATHPVAE